jgi:hypothetical protein
MGFLVNGLVVVTHASYFLLLHFVDIAGGHETWMELFGGNDTQAANQHAALLMCPILNHDYRKHVVWLFWCIGLML